jgi:hypothetical protein
MLLSRRFSKPDPNNEINMHLHWTDRVLEIGTKTILTIILILISLPYFTADRPFTIIDGTDLLFHEAGHLIFAFAGEFIGMLGGSLIQILIPIGIGLYFAARKSWYSFLFCVYWLGINLIYVAVYISDAQSMSLPLVAGGSIHDWNYLLSKTGLLLFDQMIGNGVRGIGRLCILIAEVTMGIHLFTLLYRNYVKHTDVIPT